MRWGPLGRLPLPVRMGLVRPRGGGVATVLRPTVAAVPGTDRLQDAAVGTPIGPATGLVYTQFGVDAGYVAGAAVGVRRLYTAHSVAVGTVVGAPSNVRRSAIAGFTDTDYVSLDLGSGPYAFLGKFVIPAPWATNVQILSRDPALTTGDRWLLRKQSANLQSIFVTGAGAGIGVASSIVAPGVGTWYIGAVGDSVTGNTAVYLWDSAGALVSSNAVAGTARTIGPGNWFGRGTVAGQAVTGTVGPVVGWSAFVPTQAQFQAIVDALVAGVSIDAMYADVALTVRFATLPTDGMISGAVDTGSPGVLLVTPTGGVTAELY